MNPKKAKQKPPTASSASRCGVVSRRLTLCCPVPLVKKKKKKNKKNKKNNNKKKKQKKTRGRGPLRCRGCLSRGTASCALVTLRNTCVAVREREGAEAPRGGEAQPLCGRRRQEVRA